MRALVRTTHRAGILEHGSVKLLVDPGVSDRVLKAGYKHEDIDLRFGGEAIGLTSRSWSRRRFGCIHRTRYSSTSPPPGNVTAGKCISSVSDTEVT